MHPLKPYLVVMLPALLVACAAAPLPSRPSVAVMPAPGKPFEIFRAEEAECSRYARSQMGANPAEVQERQVTAGAVSGAVIGAVAGAAIGDSSGAAASGAGIGAVMGTSAGADNARVSGRQLQRRFDIAYEQCMYAKGNQIPTVSTPYRTYPAAQAYPPPNTRTQNYPAPNYPPPNTPPPGW